MDQQLQTALRKRDAGLEFISLARSGLNQEKFFGYIAKHGDNYPELVKTHPSFQFGVRQFLEGVVSQVTRYVGNDDVRLSICAWAYQFTEACGMDSSKHLNDGMSFSKTDDNDKMRLDLSNPSAYLLDHTRKAIRSDYQHDMTPDGLAKKSLEEFLQWQKGRINTPLSDWVTYAMAEPVGSEQFSKRIKEGIGLAETGYDVSEAAVLLAKNHLYLQARDFLHSVEPGVQGLLRMSYASLAEVVKKNLIEKKK